MWFMIKKQTIVPFTLDPITFIAIDSKNYQTNPFVYIYKPNIVTLLFYFQ